MPPGAKHRQPTGAINRPIIRRIIAEVSAEMRVKKREIAGATRRSTRAAALARRLVIARLLGQPCGFERQYGIAEIGRALGIDHSTAHYHIKKWQSENAETAVTS